MRKLLIIMLAFMTYSCQSTLQDKIIDKIQLSCQKGTSIIKIKDITPFDWEKMYLFQESADLQEINKRLGFNYIYYKDIAKRLVFTKSNQVVYHEDEFPYPDKKIANKVFFKFESDSIKSMMFTKENAVFSVLHLSSGDLFYYELKPIR